MKVWAVTLTLLLCAAQLEAREPIRIQSRWSELAPKVTDKKVTLITRDGISLGGRVVAVETDGLRMDISKTSNRKVHAKGRQLVPRQGLTSLKITERRGYGRAIGTVGAAGAAGAIVAASNPNINEGVGIVVVPLVMGIGVIGAGLAGYFIGRSLDTRVTEISLVN